MNKLLKITGIVVVTVALAACSTNRPIVPSGITLPPRSQIIPDKEPKPRIAPSATTDVIALEYAAAFGRANQRIEDGGENYENLANTLAARR